MMPAFQQLFDEMLANIEAYRDGYPTPTLHYLAEDVAGSLQLIQARLNLASDANAVLQSQFRSARLRAGELFLPPASECLQDIAKAMLNDHKIQTPSGTVHIRFDDTARCNFSPFHREGIAAQARLSVLVAEPSQASPHIDGGGLDWEVRGADAPFESLAELTSVYNLGTPRLAGSLFEVVAGQVALIEYGSPVSGSTARPLLRMKRTLSPDFVNLGVRVLSDRRVVRRFSVGPDQIVWTLHPDGYLAGHTEFSIPEAALVHCIFRYRGEAIHYAWLQDRARSQNARRVVNEAFDGNFFALVHELVFTEPGKGKIKSGDFEQAVSWLLWTLGFSVELLGLHPRTTDAADLVAVTPSGHVALVECTTGLLKHENKVANLAARTVRARTALEQSALGHIRVLPVMVTSRTRKEVGAEIDATEALGILVVTRENLVDALDVRSRLVPDADRLFADAETYISTRLKPPAPPTGDMDVAL